MQDIINMIINSLRNISVWSIVDIIVVSYILYRGYLLMKETRAEQLFKGILLVLALIPISYVLKLDMLNFILTKTITIGVLAVIIIFQPEIRRALEHLGRSAFEDMHLIEDDAVLNSVVTEIVAAVENLAESKTGALIAIEQGTGLSEVIGNNGTVLDAKVSAALLENIFVVNTPLHDGATIIRNDRILASGCVLPLTGNNTINKKLGTRHRAALGLSENSDALVIVVSEETGVISLAVNGRLTRNFDKEKLKSILIKIMKKRRKKRVKSIEERVKAWIMKKRRKI
ncbi:diadenylate cyclase CdaA [Inconstantimicrobium mannanitabidum]|uniref:Membrane protein n=1 Tax=Inconstantimicrobium mannanitabidum TaxID=1604901 RepID=A0ACB5RIE0_9CLOT|nr:diadenylate cyclase CdaA [Clostridium sp. TW13]GKX68891.1 membrane protein [Clostridium sp. TW13]